MEIKNQTKKKIEQEILSTSCPIPRAGIGFWKEQTLIEPISIQNEISDSSSRRPFLIGVAGGTASGKTTVCRSIIEKLDDQRVSILSMDSFYRALIVEELEHVADHNFDHPDAFDWDLLKITLEALSRGKTTSIPTYDFTKHNRVPTITNIIHASISDIIIIEGILLFHSPQILDLLDMKLFVDTDSDTRLVRRVRRDMSERGRTLDSVLNQYERFVKPAFDQFILPSKKHADVIIPRGSSNTVAIDLIVLHIKQKLAQKRANREQRSLMSIIST